VDKQGENCWYSLRTNRVDSVVRCTFVGYNVILFTVFLIAGSTLPILDIEVNRNIWATLSTISGKL
jgi:hypothetical protein